MKLIEIDDKVLEDLLESVMGSSAYAMWLYVCEDILTWDSPYEDRKQFFLSVMYRLMKEGRLKLAFQGKFLEGTIEEQVALYSERWPKNEADLAEFDFQFTQDHTTGKLIDFWPLCGFVWFYENGFVEGT